MAVDFVLTGNACGDRFVHTSFRNAEMNPMLVKKESLQERDIADFDIFAEVSLVMERCRKRSSVPVHSPEFFAVFPPQDMLVREAKLSDLLTVPKGEHYHALLRASAFLGMAIKELQESSSCSKNGEKIFSGAVEHLQKSAEVFFALRFQDGISLISDIARKALDHRFCHDAEPLQKIIDCEISKDIYLH